MLPVAMACQSGAPREPESVALKPFESATFPEFTLTFIDVENDSRCPAQMMCIWVGNAVVAVTARTYFPPVAKGSAAAKQFLNTNIDPRSLTLAGVTLTLDSLTPARITADTIPQAKYTAYFTVLR